MQNISGLVFFHVFLDLGLSFRFFVWATLFHMCVSWVSLVLSWLDEADSLLFVAVLKLIPGRLQVQSSLKQFVLYASQSQNPIDVNPGRVSSA